MPTISAAPLTLVAVVALIGGCGSTDYRQTSCAEFRGDRAAMTGAESYVLAEINDPDVSKTRVGAYIAHACHGKPNQTHRPVDKVIRRFRGLRKGFYVDVPSPAFVRCYVRPTNAGCGTGELEAAYCEPDYRTSDCSVIQADSEAGRLARAEFP